MNTTHNSVILINAHSLNEKTLDLYKKIESTCYGEVYLLFHQNDKTPSDGFDGMNCFFFDNSILKNMGYWAITDSFVPGSNHFPLLYFYRSNPSYQYYWYIEYDVDFNGDWNYFFDSFSHNETDLITSHIRNHEDEPFWPWFNTLKNPSIEIPIEYRLRSFNPIYRISSKALSYINECLLKGWIGHHEVLLPTLLHHSEYEIMDFGGIGKYVPDGTENKFYIEGCNDNNGAMQTGTMRFRPEINEMNIKNRLYHPVKERRSATSHLEIDIITHCNTLRITRVLCMANTVPADINIICTVYGTQENTEQFLRDKMISLPANLKLYYCDNSTEMYPFNKLRNSSFKKSTSKYVMYIDVDFVFMPDFWEVLKQKYFAFLDKGYCLCPIALSESKKPPYLNHIHDDLVLEVELVETHEKHEWHKSIDQLQLFKYHEYWSCKDQQEDIMDISKIMHALRKSDINPEPWGILHRDNYYFADEDFVGPHKDKMQFVANLLDNGIKFLSMKDMYIYHLWHKNTNEEHNKIFAVNQLLWEKRYGKKYAKYLFLNASTSSCKNIVDYFIKEHTKKQSNFNYFDTGKKQSSDQLEIISKMKQNTSCIFGNLYFSNEYLKYCYRIILFLNPEDISGAVRSLTGNKNDFFTASYVLQHVSIIFDLSKSVESFKKLQNISGIELNKDNMKPSKLKFNNEEEKKFYSFIQKYFFDDYQSFSL